MVIRTSTTKNRTVVTATADGHRVGKLVVKASWGTPAVERIDVKPEHRRRHIATRMYEAAAREVCRKWGEPLRSDYMRSSESDAFWQKQLAKGRAHCVHEKSGKCLQYELKPCPAPETLDGTR